MAAAKQARDGAYAPYSGYPVGAAVLCDDGEIVTGCNVENASYGLSMCAERVAVFAARARGKKPGDLLCVAGPSGHLTAPCGACRQVMHEYNPAMTVVFTDVNGDKTAPLRDLLPHAFVLSGDAADFRS